MTISSGGTPISGNSHMCNMFVLYTKLSEVISQLLRNGFVNQLADWINLTFEGEESWGKRDGFGSEIWWFNRTEWKFNENMENIVVKLTSTNWYWQ